MNEAAGARRGLRHHWCAHSCASLASETRRHGAADDIGLLRAPACSAAAECARGRVDADQLTNHHAYGILRRTERASTT